jgi:phage-related protein
MTSTGQQVPAEGAPDSSSGKQAPEAPKETRQVPLDALAEARQKARAAEDKIAEMQAELARLKNTDKQVAQPPPQQDFEAVAKTLREMQQRERMRDLAADLGLADSKQAQVVADLLAKNSDLTPAEALDLAAKRNAELFKDRGQPGFDPRVHGSTRPRAGTPPEPQKPDFRARLDHAAKKLAGKTKDEFLDNMIGAMAAKAKGWRDHKKAPFQP